MKKVLMLFAIISLSISFTSAQQKIFIKPDNIDGESTDAAHLDWIEAKAFSAQAIFKGTGTPPVTTSPFKFSMCVDKSANPLYVALYQHTAIPKVKADFVIPGTIPYTYYKIEMDNVFITEISEGGTTADDRLLLNISFTPQKVTYSYYEQKANGSVVLVSSVAINL